MSCCWLVELQLLVYIYTTFDLLNEKGDTAMPNVYVEARPKGRPEGSAITDYVVEDHADHVLQPLNPKGGDRMGQAEWSFAACSARAPSQR